MQSNAPDTPATSQNAVLAQLNKILVDPLLPQAHAVLASVLALYDWDWKRAEQEFQAALRSAPGSPESHQYYASFLLSPEGRGTEAVAQAQEALRLSPLSLLARAVEGYSLFFAGRWDEAAQHAPRVIDLDPEYFHPYLYLGWSLDRKGLLAEAFQAIQTADRLAGSTTITHYELAVAHAKMNRRAEALAIAHELESAADHGADVGVALAHIYAALGKRDRAIQALSRALQDRSPMLIYIRLAHDYDPLRSDPRFAAISRAVGLEN